jgi:hypothetical protein
MKSFLRILLPLGLLLVVVFAITYFSVMTPGGDPTEKETGLGGGGGADTAAGRPLVFFTATRRWDPNSSSLADQAFTGFYEPGENPQVTQFWFENRNPFPVSLQLLGVSCSSCSGGRVAPLPPDAARALLQMAAVSALPFGPVAGCPTGMAGTGAFLTSRLEWQAKSFRDGPGAVKYAVPGADDKDGWTPSWGILELNFKVRQGGSNPLKAAFATLAESGAGLGRDEFSIYYEPAAAFDVDKSAIEAGEMTDNTPAQTHVVTVYSSARGPDELPDLTARVIGPGGGDGGPFVTVGKPEPVPAAELERLAADLTRKTSRAVRVRAAYRLTVTVTPKSGEQRADIGRLEREVFLTANVPGLEPRRVTVRGVVTGPVIGPGGVPEVNLGSFRSQSGASETVVLTTEQPGAVLEVVAGSARPDFLEASVRKVGEVNGRGQWQLSVRVPPGRVQGEVQDGLVVLELKGPTPQRVRVPVRGRGVL